MQFTNFDGVLLCSAWARFAWQKHGFGTREHTPFPAMTLHQVHSNIVQVAGAFADREREGDALVTAECERSIGARTADCVPILLLDPGTHAVAAVHAGWRGTAARIIATVVEKLESEHGSNRYDLEAAIGPCIRACCYEVSEDVAGRFSATAVSREFGARPHLDLAAANKEQMLECGMASERIYDCELCTFCHPELFYSYRRDPADPGRMLSCICRIA